MRDPCAAREAGDLRTARTERTEETLPVDGGLLLVSELTLPAGASIKTQGI